MRRVAAKALAEMSSSVRLSDPFTGRGKDQRHRREGSHGGDSAWHQVSHYFLRCFSLACTHVERSSQAYDGLMKLP